jgi:ribulose-phosphate 3-epimerase
MADVLRTLENADVVAVHLDVMDGHFVPNLTYGPPLIAAWRPYSNLVFDAHLMIAEPRRYLDAFLEAGCDQITIHIEAVGQPQDLIHALRAAGARVGIALNPPTPLEAITPHLDAIDQVLIMSVMPGFGGQSFDPTVRPKIRALRALRPQIEIAVDGGIKPSNAAQVVQDGATHLVVGSAIFGDPQGPAAAISQIRQAARATGEIHG